jgi:hypothetical protein
MVDLDHILSELELFEMMTADYVGSIVRAAKAIPDEKWNWSFSPMTPSAREICEHAFVWLWCDRQQLTVADRDLHRPTPDLPGGQEATISLLVGEAEEWRRMVRSLMPEVLSDLGVPWPGETRTVRSFLFHAGQHIIYKAGQIWMLYFGLGLDGNAPYSAPYPNNIYEFADCAPWPASREG